MTVHAMGGIGGQRWSPGQEYHQETMAAVSQVAAGRTKDACARAMAVQFRDYYGVLDVARTATEDEIKQAYCRLACTYHPDVNAGDATAEEKFKDAGEAYAVLSRKQLRPQRRAHRVPAHL